jgi:hypothetical protein
VQVYEATAPAEQHVSGPGTISHAFPENSRVSLCGITRSEDPPIGHGSCCQTCLDRAGRKSWVGR